MQLEESNIYSASRLDVTGALTEPFLLVGLALVSLMESLGQPPVC